MISRLRLTDPHLFELFIELSYQTESVDQRQQQQPPYIIKRYPEDYNDEEVLNSVPKFAFPYKTYESSGAVENFAFVLTDMESKFRFGFCRLSADTNTCLCLMSLFVTLNGYKHTSALPLLGMLYNLNTFSPGESINVVALSTNEKYSFICPVENQLPTVPENTNLSLLLSLLDINNLMALFASMIHERRILVVSGRLSRLTACIHAAAALLYPMCWQHLYIPVLPSQLLDYCSAPMPYLIGLHSSIYQTKRKTAEELGDAVILDVDANTLTTEYNDLAGLPAEVVSTLKRHLKVLYADKGTNRVVGDGVSRAFLKALVALIGGYRDALKFHPGQPITFDPEAFIISRVASMRPFLRRFLQMQIFQQFVTERLIMLNEGEGFHDEFEMEVSMCGDKWGAQSRYKEWHNHMRGKKLRREGKDKWFEFTAKVKVKSKKTIKELKSKMDDNRKVENGRSFVPPHLKMTDSLRPALRPTLVSISRDLSPAEASWQASLRQITTERAPHYRLMSPDDTSTATPSIDFWKASIDDSSVTETSLHSLRRVNTDLFTDPDIQNVFKKSYSLEDLPTDIKLDQNSETDIELAEASSVADCWVQFQVGRLDTSQPVISNTDDSSLTSEICSKSSDISQDSPNIKGSGLVSLSRPPSTIDHCSRNDRSPESQRHLPVAPTSLHKETYAYVEEPLVALNISQSLQNMELDECKDRNNVSLNRNVQDANKLCLIETPTISLPRPKSPVVLIAPAGSSLIAPPAVTPQRSVVSEFVTPPVESVKTTASTSILQQTKPASSSSSEGSSLLSWVPYSAPHATDAQSIKGARSLFMQMETSKPTIFQDSKQGSFDQFDPLATGQLVIDSYNPSKQKSSSHQHSQAEEDENLLKEWSLDFNFKSQPRRMPAAPISPLSQPFANMPFNSMPNLRPQMFHQPYSTHGYNGNVMQYPAQHCPVSPCQSNQGLFMNTQSVVTLPAKMPVGNNTSLGNVLVQAHFRTSTLPVNSSLFQGNGNSFSADKPMMQQHGAINVQVNNSARPHSVDLNTLIIPAQWEQFE